MLKEGTQIIETEEEEPVEEIDAVAEINKLKNDYVSKQEYEKVVKEKNNYFKALVNGEQVSTDTKPEQVDIAKLRNELFSEDSSLTNLEFAKKTLQLRDALIESEGRDIFCPTGKNIVAEDSDYSDAQQVADALSHCIEVADNNSDIFRRELSRITVDSSPARTAINSKIRR